MEKTKGCGMKERTLLFVSDCTEEEQLVDVVSCVSPLMKAGFGRIDCFSPYGSDEWKRALSSVHWVKNLTTGSDLTVQAIFGAARQAEAACICLHVRKRDRWSLIKRLVDQTTMPLIVMDSGTEGELLLDHVVLAVDSFLPSEDDLRFLLSLKDAVGELEIIHVITEKLTVRGLLDLKGRLAAFRKICLNNGIDAESHIYAGKTVDEIMTATGDYRGTVIVVGTTAHGSSSQRLFREQNAVKVMQRSSVPVIVVPLKSE